MLFSYTQDLNPKVVFASFIEPQTQIAVNEIFEVKLETKIISQNINDIYTNFVGGKHYKILNPKSLWIKSAKNSYTNTYYMHLTSKKALMPKFKVIVEINDNVKLSQYNNLTPFMSQNQIITFTDTPKYPRMNLIEFLSNKKYVGVIARNLNIISNKSKSYDKSSNLILLDIKSTLGNLEDFSISDCSKDGIDELSNNFPSTTISYYCILPKNKDQLTFNYFNSTLNKFQQISINIKPEIERLSTQTEINPTQNKFLLYKNIGSFILFFIILILFIFKRTVLYFLFLVISGIYVAYNLKPLDTLLIEKNSSVKILPTKNSTVIFLTQKKLNAKKLYNKNNHTKILLPNSKIGWIDNENILETKSFFSTH